MSITRLISNSNFIVINKTLIKVLGLEETIMLGELASEHDYWEQQKKLEDGYFYSTIENVEENTSLNDYKQRKILSKLKDMNIVDIKLKGVPAKRYIKIDDDQVLKILNTQFLNDLKSSS